MSAIDDMMAQFQISDEERRKIMIQNALLGLGAGLMSSGKGKGSWLNSAGQGMLLGAQMGQNAVQDARAAKVSDFKMREYMEGAQAKKAAEEARAREAQQLAGIFSGQPDLSQMGPGGPTPDNAQRVIPDRAKQYLKAADFYASRGDMEKAAKAQAMAEEEFAATPQTVMRDGRAVNVLVGKRGGVKEMTGYDPTPKFREVSTNDARHIVNEYNVPSGGMSFAAGMSPYQTESLGLEQEKFKYQKNRDAQQGSGAAKPQLVNGQWVYPPDAANPTGRAVTPSGLSAGAGDKLTESQGTASLYLGMMKTANDDMAGAPRPGIGDIALARGDVRYTPESVQNMFASPEAQKYVQSSLQWTEAMLRITTGATAPPEEIVRTSKTFFPQLGDSQEVIDQKNKRREQMEKFVAIKAGGGAAQVDAVLGQGRPGGRNVVRTGTDKKTGRKVIQYSDGTVAYQ